MRKACLTLLLALSSTAFAEEPRWQPALGYGGAPQCPIHAGSRTYRSDIVRDAHTTALLTGTNRHDSTGCHPTAELQITIAGKTKRFNLSNPEKRNFSLVDFSPDGSQLLLAFEDRKSERYQHRDVSVATMLLANGEMNWRNTWDIFGWKDCDAMMEPQGFLPDGRLVIRARKSVRVGDSYPNCVNEVGLYAVDITADAATRLPDSTKVVRYGNRERPGFQACKSDPDIVAACFKVHGRLSAWNGTPTMRIWRIGTDRILGVHDGIMPESLTSKMDWNVEAYGDYEVCPFRHRRFGEMQMVCIESAKHVVVKSR